MFKYCLFVRFLENDVVTSFLRFHFTNSFIHSSKRNTNIKQNLKSHVHSSMFSSFGSVKVKILEFHAYNVTPNIGMIYKICLLITITILSYISTTTHTAIKRGTYATPIPRVNFNMDHIAAVKSIGNLQPQRHQPVAAAINDNCDTPFINTAPKYRTAPIESRRYLNEMLTPANRRNAADGVRLREYYMLMRQLTPEEERSLGKFSTVSKQLDKINNFLIHRNVNGTADAELQNSVASLSQLSAVCNMSVAQILTYQYVAIQARERLVLHSMRLVDFWARRLIAHTAGGKEVSYHELVLRGALGLSRAAQGYDGRPHSRFFSYAEPFVLSELYRGLTQLRPGCLLSYDRIKISYSAHRAKLKLWEQLQRAPSLREVAAYLKVDEERLRGAMSDVKLKTKFTSIYASVGGDVGSSKARASGSLEGTSFSATYLDIGLTPDMNGDAVSSNEAGSRENQQRQWQADFQTLLQVCLTPVERRILCLRYGLDGCGFRDYQEGEKIGKLLSMYDNMYKDNSNMHIHAPPPPVLRPQRPGGGAYSAGQTAELMCFSTEYVRRMLEGALEKLRVSPLAAAVLLEASAALSVRRGGAIKY